MELLPCGPNTDAEPLITGWSSGSGHQKELANMFKLQCEWKKKMFFLSSNMNETDTTAAQNHIIGQDTSYIQIISGITLRLHWEGIQVFILNFILQNKAFENLNGSDQFKMLLNVLSPVVNDVFLDLGVFVSLFEFEF